MTLDLPTQLRDLRRSGQIESARALLSSRLASSGPAPTSPAPTSASESLQHQRLALLAWQHAPFWWQPLMGRTVGLRRRGPADLALLRHAWANAEFMRRFNRMAAPLPEQDDALQALLNREHWALPEESRALHWTIESGGQGCGFVSVVDISLQHRRGEFLIGVLPNQSPHASPWLALEAAHLAFEFLAARMKLERLTAYFYPDNLAALNMSLRLGFEQEGVLKSYLRLPEIDARSDLIVAGLLLNPTFFKRNLRLRRRLFSAR